ncbi:MAG TPA: CHAD domain-containing protein [Burkholderiales bacterium]|nr:CHAD domain-containing protein [Burkholderiales bacterium]
MTLPRRWSRPRIVPRTGAGEAFAANVRSAVVQIDGNLHGSIHGRDPEYLHQLRVGLRRLRATLRAFRPLVKKQKASEFDGQLRDLLHALGVARDWDVFSRSQLNAGLLRAARERSARERRAVRVLLRSTPLRGTLHEVLAWANSGPWRSAADPDAPVPVFARRALRRLRDSLREDAAGIDWGDAEPRHRVRIKVKRLRYGCECFAAAYTPEATRRFLKRLRALQRILGELNDISVQRRLLQELARDARLRRGAATSKARLTPRERALIDELARAWVEFESLKPFWRRAAIARARG